MQSPSQSFDDQWLINTFTAQSGRKPQEDELTGMKQHFSRQLRLLQQQPPVGPLSEQKMVIASDVLDEIKTRFGHELRLFQREALEDGVLAKRDLFLIADTNAGKSIVFTCSPLVLRSPRLLRPICICVSPLNSLMRSSREL